MAKLIKFEGRTISVPDDATDDEITGIIDSQVSTSENKSVVEPKTPETIRQKLEKAKQGVADVENMVVHKPNESINQTLETLGVKVPSIIKRYAPALDLPVKSTIQGAASGPVMGAVQMGADALGNKKLSDEIAKNAREGNFIGGMMQPEALLTGGAAGKFIGQGGNFASKALRAGAVTAPYGATSVIANPSDSALADRATQGGIAGLSAMVLSPVAEGVTRVGQHLVDAVRRRAGKVNAGNIARDIAGDKLDDIKLANANAPSDITSAQATADVDRDVWQSLGKMAERKDQNSYYRMLGDKQEAGRVIAMEAVKPDLNTAEAARKSASNINYPAAYKNQFKADPDLAKMSQNPYFEKAINEASDLTQSQGVTFKNNPTEYLQNVKIGLDKMLSRNGDTALADSEKRAVNELKNNLVTWMGKKNPAYDFARIEHKRLSEPVNQAKVIDAMVNTLKNPKGGERVTPFLNAMGTGEDALIKRADQSPRFGGLDEILNPQQKSARDKVVSELLRDANVERKATAGAGGMADILIGDSWKARLPPFVDAKFAAANKILDVVETKVNKNTMKAIVDGMKSGKSANEMLNTLPSGERIKVIQALKNQKVIPYMSGAITSAQQQGEQ